MTPQSPAGRRSPWTQAEVEQLVAQYEAGDPLTEIAAQLNRSEVAVRTRLALLRRGGLIASRRRRAPQADAPERRTRALELWADGASYRQIASELDIAVGTVGVWLHAARARDQDVARRKPAAWGRAEVERGFELLERGETVSRVAELLGRPEASVRRRLADRLPKQGAWSRSDDERLIAHYQDGATLEAIASELARGPDAVFNRIQRLRASGVRLPPRRPRWTPTQQARLMTRRREGATYSQLAHEFGRSKGTISTQLGRLRRLEGQS